MKKLTCKDLGGPCDHEITGDTFEEMGNNSKSHVMEMVQAGDESHKSAIEDMKNKTPEEQMAAIGEFKKKFEEALEM